MIAASLTGVATVAAHGQTAPVSQDPRLAFTTVVQGLPTGIDNLVSAFVPVSEDTLLLGYRADGTIRQVTLRPGQAALPGPVLVDLPIITRTPGDTQAEYGIQGLVTHPQFPAVPWVYVRYSQSLDGVTDMPQAMVTEFSTPVQSVVERLTWTQPAAPNPADPSSLIGRLERTSPPTIVLSTTIAARYHHGGPPTFGPDGRLYVPIGDYRLSTTLGINTGPTPVYQAGVILRINPDGSLPPDNPFSAAAGSPPGTDTWFAFGFRNQYGLAFDPAVADFREGLWCTDNGEAMFDELNRVPIAANGGHARIMGPVGHPRQSGSLTGLVSVPGTPASAYVDPVFSWLQTNGVTALLFLHGSALGPVFDDWVLTGNYNTAFLFRLRLTADRRAVRLTHPGLADRVDDRVPFSRNPVGTEAEELLLARNVGSPFAGVIAMARGMDGLPLILTADGRVIRISRACPADVVGIGGEAGSGPDGLLTGDDFNAFIGAFAAGDPLADITGVGGPPATPDGLLTGDDFVAFVSQFADGCP
ncbi:MAG: PQQ-dependent sugar dehydrogenase [Phycisphaerales bacterium]|jgi:hypothetical protein|nr:PQQ-dependent sugar dehydrogenase [Phycisphaerales bacterium]